MIEINCAECGNPFLPKTRRQRCCSSACGNLYYRKAHRVEARRRAKEWHVKNPHKKHPYKRKPVTFSNCPQCNTPFQNTVNKQFCCRSCQAKHRRKTNPQWYKDAHARYREKRNAHCMENYHKRRAASPWSPLLAMAKVRAKAKGTPFTLTAEWIARAWNGRCALTGIPFALGRSRREIFSPSIDQIKANAGYTPENCRFILWGLNAMKGSNTDEDMLFIAKTLIQKHLPDVAGILALPG